MNATVQAHFESFKADVEGIGENDWHDQPGEFGGDSYQSFFIGTVFSIFPSGKYYMPWTTNQTEEDVELDAEFKELVEEWLGERNMWLESGEGNPCDLFVCRHAPDEAESEDE